MPKGQKFFIKFHDFTIQSNQVSKFFVKKMDSLGYHAVDVDRYLKTCYQGMIPAELLIGKLKLKRVISVKPIIFSSEMSFPNFFG